MSPRRRDLQAQHRSLLTRKEEKSKGSLWLGGKLV